MADKDPYRDDKGRLVKGHPGLPGAGRPLKKREKLDKLIEQFYGDECEQIVVNMMEIAQYDQDLDFKNTKPSLRRHWKAKYTNQQVVDARKFLFEHYFGRPIQETKTELSSPQNAKIELEFVDKDEKE